MISLLTANRVSSISVLGRLAALFREGQTRIDTVAIVIVLVVDLDRPARGLIRVPTQALIDVAKEIQP